MRPQDPPRTRPELDSRVGRYLRRAGDVFDPPAPRSSRDALTPRVRRLMVDLDAADERWAKRYRAR